MSELSILVRAMRDLQIRLKNAGSKGVSGTVLNKLRDQCKEAEKTVDKCLAELKSDQSDLFTS